jgi:tRNA threonylcarbamoyladenosine biosynthesis protein TsaE
MTATVVDLAALEREGEHLGRTLPAGTVVWLAGPLGAGKTTLARAIVRGRGLGDDAASPTYALVHHYPRPGGDIYHIDCYRARRPDDVADLDWETLGAADLLLIEWPERAGSWAPPPTCRITLAYEGDDTRRLEVSC